MNLALFEKRALLLLASLILLFYWRLGFSDQFTFLESPDLVHQVLPWYQAQARSWHDGVFPMWDAYAWAGQPLLGQMQPGGAFPLNWPLFLAPLGDDGFIQLRYIHWQRVFMLLLAGLFTFGLARELNLSRAGALVAGLAFPCAGYIGTVAWPQMLHGAIWLPLTLMLFHRAARHGWGARGVIYAVLCGGSVGMSLLAGHHQTPFFSLLALGGVFLYFAYREKQQESWLASARLAALFALVAVTSFLVGGLQLLPAYEYGELAYRWVDAPEPIGFDTKVPYYAHHAHRLYPVSLLGLIVPHAHFQVSTFVGLFCLTMAVFAVATCWERRAVRLYAAMAALALVYGFGQYSLLHGWVYQFFPIADKARNAGHSVFIFQLAVFILAAHGVDRLLKNGPPEAEADRWLARLQKALLGIAALAWAAVFWRGADARLEAAPGDQYMLVALTALILAGLYHAARRRALAPAPLYAGLVFLMLSEMYSLQWHDIQHREDPNGPRQIEKLTRFDGVMNFLKRQPGRFRYELVSDEGQINAGAWHGVEAVDGSLASVLADIYDLFSRTGWTEGRLLVNTVYTIAKQKTRDVQEEVYADEHWKVFRNTDAHPRGWFEYSAQNITRADRSAEGLPRPPPCDSKAEIHFRRWTMHRTLIDLFTACEGYLVVGDPFYPGWTISIDGEKGEIYRAYGALRAIFLPRGSHTVEFVYRPQPVYAGGALTGAGLLLCLAAGMVALWLRRRGA